MNDLVKVEFRRDRLRNWRRLRAARMSRKESSLVVIGRLALAEALALFNGMHACQLRIESGRRYATVDGAYVVSVQAGDRRGAKVRFHVFGRVRA